MTASSRGRSTGRSLLALYPRWWRDRYGDEIALILEARPPDLAARIDLLRGAFDAHLGVAASLVAALPVSRLAWSSNRPSLEVAVVGAVVGYSLWAAALFVAIVGGPYGAVTAIAQSLAAIATVGLGLVLLRAGVHPVGEILLVAGTVMLLPTPDGWVLAGALWTGLGLWQIVDARSDDVPGAPRPISR